ncbi:AraC family ligand binding domain-containing protein [Pedobacter jeongneungensis]|uniref:AraC family ligand binding domain-containing protein n=1 Tax=Pedobacter jeongneungensis TaxID=947309 RepID=UPI000A8023E7|nr:AraC family ligand binding domain-containing protein [Pedobacter jeongneungensis]
MSKAQIHLLELASSRYGIVVSPMLSSFLDTEEAAPTLGPHRHDYHALFLLSSGAITMRIEGQIIDMSPCSILIVQPGQIHQYIHSSNVSGWIMFLDGKILDTKVRTVIEQSKNSPKIIPLSGEEALFLDQILSSINQAAVEKIPGNFQTQMIHALANTLFYKTADLLLLQQNSNEVLTNRASKIVQDYKDLIKLNFKKFTRPAAYASLLHISVNHLNDCVKTQTGYSATRI